MKAFYAGNIPYPDPYIGKYCVILDLHNNFSTLRIDAAQWMCCQQDFIVATVEVTFTDTYIFIQNSGTQHTQ